MTQKPIRRLFDKLGADDQIPEFTLHSDSSFYVDTKLFTKYGPLNFRVYRDQPNKETIVLWSQDLDITNPVLVRIHSECLTGDIFSSHHCDCGRQLHRALNMIRDQGGLLIYLRQEGRGIGLFDKIRAYNLQTEGYDTHDANILLGHRPDERTYEMAAQALKDLSISKIRLLTNNPSKVSEIAKFGISIVERVPLITRPNQHNKKYISAKRAKFQHLDKESTDYYTYQFHPESPKDVKQIAKTIKTYIRDPFLKIGIGIDANHSSLISPKEIERINRIINSCNEFDFTIPILHFTFRDSPNIMQDLERIKNELPSIERVQLNDLPSPALPFIQRASELFHIDLPLCEDSISLIENQKLLMLVRTKKIHILLDNSKGTGRKEPLDSIKRKIEMLLATGANSIGIAGGFGPDNLDVYFELKRFYRINLSIDAQSNLKSNGILDLKKVERYLNQLVRFDDPKSKYVSQTREFLEQQNSSTWRSYNIDEREFSIHPRVFNSGVFPSTSWYAKKIVPIVEHAQTFCEVGCGSGVVSCLVALANPRIRIVSTDISPFATYNTKVNGQRLGVGDRMNVLSGDVLDNIQKGAKFDFIFWALPFGFLDPGVDINLEERQVFDPGYRSIRKFFSTAKKHLNPGGQVLIGFSTDLGHPELLETIANEFHLSFEIAAQHQLLEKESLKFELLKGIYTDDEKSAKVLSECNESLPASTLSAASTT